MTEIQYITDANGHRTGVIIPMSEYEQLLSGLTFIEEVEDEELLQAMKEIEDSPEVSREEIFQLLERDA